MKALTEMLKTADIHADRIRMALSDLQPWLPFEAAKIDALDKNALLLTDLLVYRFGKLQDLLGTKIINASNTYSRLYRYFDHA